MPAIRIMDLEAQSVMTVPGAGATNFNPIWLGGDLYFLSDRNDERFNIHRYDPDSGAIAQVSGEQSWDVRSASGFGSEIVYEAGGRLWRLNTDSGAVSEIVISINPDLPQLRTQWKDASSIVQGVDISPSGKRAIITARGDVFTVPVDEGSTRNLTDTGGTREYSALWSPGGKEVAWVTEAEDGQALVVADQTGIGDSEVFALGPHFYPNMHGLDWDAVYEQYRPLVAHVGRREDLSALIVEMIAEMQVGHNRAGGGDIYREDGAATGVLGANLVVENDRYRIARIYTGEAWNPFLEAPLAVPGNEAIEGEYILAVDGRALTGGDNIFEFLQGTVGRQVRLRVGYVYLPDTADFGYTFFNRMFFAQIDREAMIVDERSNGGGQAANYITDVLSRRHLSGWKDRDGLIFNTPAGAMHGPKLMMIDQDAGSGGDYLPYAFRELGIGKLLGTRTWGGLIGISANPSLIDGGALVVPFFRFFDADGNWAIENEGVTPDIDVTLDPIAANEGRDTQLERAIEEILTELERNPSPVPSEAPPYPTVLGE